MKRLVYPLLLLVMVVVLTKLVACVSPVPTMAKFKSRSSQLHLLDKTQILKSERRPWHPNQLVAILGDQRGQHWKGIDYISCSLDGKRIATIASGGTLRGSIVYIWDASSLALQTLLPIEATFIHFIPQENVLLTCSKDGLTELWNIDGSAPVKERRLIKDPNGNFRYRGTALSPDGKKLITKTHSYGARSETSLVLYDFTTSSPIHANLPNSRDLTLYSAAFSPDSRRLATLTGKEINSRGWSVVPYSITNLKVTIWDVSGRKPRQSCTLPGPCGEWDNLTYSPDGKKIVVGARLWDLTEARPRISASMLFPKEEIPTYVFNADGSRTIWNIYAEYERNARTTCFSPDGIYTFMARIKDHGLNICSRDMRPRNPRIIQTESLRGPLCGAIAVAPNGNNLFVGEMNSLHVWPIKDGKIQVHKRSYGHLSDVTHLSFGACGNLLATASKDATLRLWDLDGTRPHHRLVLKGDMHPWGSGLKPWDSIALSPDGTKLAAESHKRGVRIWSVSSSGLRLLAQHKAGTLTLAETPENRWGVLPPTPIALAITPDSKTLFVANGKNPVKVIDIAKPSTIAAELKTGPRVIYRDVAKSARSSRQVAFPPKPETNTIADPFNVSTLAISPDGKTLALGSPHEIAIWKETEKGWSRHSGFWYLSHVIHSMAFERSGRTLLVGARGGNGEVRRFDVSGEKPVQVGETLVHESPITSVAASPNGQFLTVADEGGHVVVWSAGMVKKLHEWTFPGPVHCVAFAPDGRHLALGNGDGTVYILRLAIPARK